MTERDEFISWVRSALWDAEVAVHKVTLSHVVPSGR